MASLKSIEELKRYCGMRVRRGEQSRQNSDSGDGRGRTPRHCGGEMMDFFLSGLKRGIPAEVAATGCIGVCVKEPPWISSFPGRHGCSMRT